MLYTTPVDFSPDDKIVVTWTESVKGAGEKEFREALGEFKKGDYRNALDQLELLIVNHPDSEAASAASLYAGTLYRRLALKDGQSDAQMLMRGLKSFQFGIRTCPLKEKVKIPAMLFDMGSIYLDLNMIAESRGIFKRIMREFPSSGFAAKAQYMLAVTNMKGGDHSEALSDLSMLMFKYKKEMERERVALTGQILFSLNEFGESKKYFDEGLKKWPDYIKSNPDILHYYSECQFQNGEIIKAREGFLTLYNLYPEDKHAGFALKRAGETFTLAGNPAVAEKIFLDVLLFFPKSDDAYASMLALGDLKAKADSMEISAAKSPPDSAHSFIQDSLKYYKEVETLSKNDVLIDTARLRTARVLEGQGKYQEAFSLYNDLIGHSDKSLNNEASEALNNAINRIGIEIRKKLGRGDKLGALHLYQLYYKNNMRHIKDEKLLMEIAEIHEGLHLYKDAREIYEGIIDRNGSRKEQALYNAGRMYAQSGDDRSAVGLLGKFISEYPKSSKATEARAMAGYGLYNLKEYEKSINYLYAVMREAPYRYPEVYIRLAAILRDRDQNEDSIAVLRDMVGNVRRQTNRDALSQGYIMLGNAYYGMQRYEEAMDAYRSGSMGMDLKEGSDTVEFMIGDCLFRLGRAGEAKRVFSKLSAGSDKIIKQVSEERLKDIAFEAENLTMQGSAAPEDINSRKIN